MGNIFNNNKSNRGTHGDSLLMLAPTGASNRKPLPLGMGYVTIPSSMSVTRYKIKMEEKVNLNEFLMKYKIVETEGDIIVVEQVEHGE